MKPTLAGFSALFLMPVAPLPNIDLPTIVVSASMAGASPEVMSNTVATPLERHLGAIADVTQMTSRSSVGSTQVVLRGQLGDDTQIFQRGDVARYGVFGYDFAQQPAHDFAAARFR